MIHTDNPTPLSDDLIDFLDGSPTAFHAGQSITHRLMASGFTRLDASQAWSLKAGHGYFIELEHSAVAAFRIGLSPVAKSGFQIVGAHTDSPSLKLKLNSEKVAYGCTQVAVEVYGGPIINTWLDRDLALAGRVMVKTEQGWRSQLVDTRKAVAVIPNLAIHLNKDVNKGIEINKQTQLPALFGPADANDKNRIRALVAKSLQVSADQLGEMDLFLYDNQGASYTGIDANMISSARIDNLAMCHAITTAICDANPGQATTVGIFFDHEEIGSQTPQGADSALLKNLLERIVMLQSDNREDYFRAIAQSFMISADGAHAVHPNYADKHDSAYAPEFNKGPVIKLSANMRYATTAESANEFVSLCEEAGIPYQKVVNRSDIPSGSTIGPICSAGLGIRSIDVGNAMWAMHSIRETASVMDHLYMTKLLSHFFSH